MSDESLETHYRWMREALKVAQSALDVKEVPVGCVYVYRGEIIGRGFNRTNLTLNGTRHSEFIGYDEIRAKYPDTFREILKETDLYVTVEPCIMCGSLLRQLGVRRVFFGCANERFGGNGSILKVNSDVPPGKKPQSAAGGYKSYPGILNKDAVILLRRFYIQENENSPNAIRKERKLDLDTFPTIEYSKYLSRDDFTDLLGDEYGFIYDRNDFIDFEDGHVANRAPKRQKVSAAAPPPSTV